GNACYRERRVIAQSVTRGAMRRRSVLRPSLRRLAAVLLFCAVTLPFGPLAAQATASFDSTTGGVPFATSFIYPVGVGTVQPTWDHGNANGYFISQAFNTSCDPSAGQGYYMYGLYY